MTERPSEIARELAPLAASSAAEAERERRLPAGLSEAIRDAGLYRLCVPASLGGGEAEPAELIGAVEALAEGDAAAGWCVAVCATAGMLAAYIEPAAASEVYGDPASVAGGVFAPSGRASERDGAFELSGRWRFCSNVANCDWLMGGSVVFDGDAPRTLESGRPDIRLLLFPAGDAEVIDTWHVSGLRGTGSNDITVEALTVPTARGASLINESPRERGPLYAFPPFGLLAASIAAVALGTARGALDEIAELAGAKTPALSTRKLAERAETQSSFARAEAGFRAARTLLHAAVADAWAAARAGARSRSACAPRSGSPPPTPSRPRRRPSTPPTGSAAAALSTRRARCSDASATSTRRPSTCSSRRRPGSSPAARCSGSSSTPRSSSDQLVTAPPRSAGPRTGSP